MEQTTEVPQQDEAAELLRAPTEGTEGGGTAAGAIPASPVELTDEQVAAARAAEAERIAKVVETIQANYDFNVDVRPTAFHFKTQKDEKTKIETKRPSVTLALPYPTVQGIVDILQAKDHDADGNVIEGSNKQLDFLMETVNKVIEQQARTMLTDNLDLTAETLDVDKLSWLAITNRPKAERTGGGIPKELWEEFVTDYIAVMVEVTERPAEKIELAAKILLQKFSTVKTNFKVLEMLVGELAVYAENAANADQYTDCIEFLTDKADKLLNVTDEDLLEGLM